MGSYPAPTSSAGDSSSSLQSIFTNLLLPASRPGLAGSVLPALLDAVGLIGADLREAQSVRATATSNAFGDAQLNVDVLAESRVRAALASRACRGLVVAASSEEDPVERPVFSSSSSSPSSSSPRDYEEDDEKYAVAFDPLDGSSIIAPNWAVGTIVGVWDGPTALGASPRSAQVAAVLGVYGPRTTAVVALRLPGSGSAPRCLELGLGRDGWEVVRDRLVLADLGAGAGAEAATTTMTRYFAPANLRAASEDERYFGLVARYVRERYTLRYSGGLVPDVLHALVKGHGIYLSPVTAGSKAKLRRLYELCPLALVVECAGGKAVDPADGSNVLDRAVESCDERGGLICGTAEEVDIAMEFLRG